MKDEEKCHRQGKVTELTACLSTCDLPSLIASKRRGKRQSDEGQVRSGLVWVTCGYRRPASPSTLACKRLALVLD